MVKATSMNKENQSFVAGHREARTSDGRRRKSHKEQGRDSGRLPMTLHYPPPLPLALNNHFEAIMPFANVQYYPQPPMMQVPLCQCPMHPFQNHPFHDQMFEINRWEAGKKRSRPDSKNAKKDVELEIESDYSGSSIESSHSSLLSIDMDRLCSIVGTMATKLTPNRDGVIPLDAVNWTEVSKHFNHRNGRDCRRRWEQCFPDHILVCLKEGVLLHKPAYSVSRRNENLEFIPMSFDARELSNYDHFRNVTCSGVPEVMVPVAYKRLKKKTKTGE